LGNQVTNDSISDIMNLDRLIHSPARLAIITYLSVVEEGDAVYLLNQTGLTWGNLSANVTRLQEAGYIAVTKEFENKKPHTLLKLNSKHTPNLKELKSAAILFTISGIIFILLSVIGGKIGIFLPVGIALIIISMVYWQQSRKPTDNFKEKK
jgi:DNA-binding MarR family transcriptional regulator